MYIAFDPGGKYTGFARFNKEGQDLSKGVLEGRDQLYSFLDVIESWLISPQRGSEHLTLIIEEFELYPHMTDQMKWQKFEVCRTIGIIEGWAHAKSVTRVHFSKPANKTIGYKWAGLENRHKHDEDALVHGVFYLIQNKIRSPIS